MYKYNDYELLYLICENCEIALDIMFQKYTPLIYKRIRAFRIKEWNKEDFFQEGMVCLHKAIITYRDDKNKTFTNYFDLILQRHYIQLLRKESNIFYNLDLVGAGEYISEPTSSIHESLSEVIELCSFSEFEKIVFEKIKKGIKARDIATYLDCSRKQVYDAADRIKKKLKGARNSLDL